VLQKQNQLNLMSQHSSHSGNWQYNIQVIGSTDHLKVHRN